MTCEELGAAVIEMAKEIAKEAKKMAKALRKTEQAIKLLALARKKCCKSNNKRRRNKEPLIREKAYIRAYRNKCRRHNVRENNTLDWKVQKEEV